jgi:hypothetical protein
MIDALVMVGVAQGRDHRQGQHRVAGNAVPVKVCTFQFGVLIAQKAKKGLTHTSQATGDSSALIDLPVHLARSRRRRQSILGDA